MRKNKGITLIALVVTIVILIILATISINTVFGENGLIKKAEQSKAFNEQEKAREKLTLILSDYQIKNAMEEIRLIDFLNEKQQSGEIEDAIDNEDGTITVIIDGYEMLVQEKPLEILEIGKAGEMPPRITKMLVSATSSSITAKVDVRRLNGGIVKYFYRLHGQIPEDEYKEMTDITEEGVTKTGLPAGTKYEVKVVATNSNGTVEMTREITTTTIPIESITLNMNTAKMKMGQTITLTAKILPDNAINKTVEWTSSDNNIATVTSAGVVTAKTTGTTNITASATDGSEKSDTCVVTVVPKAGTILSEKPSNWTSTKVKPIADGEGGVLPLPDDFYYVGGDINTGMVISDKLGDTMTASGTSMGNQFVWIPVASEADLVRTNFDSNGQPTTGLLTSYTEPYVSGYSTETSEYNTMRTQVLKYGGFYIGRFEAGVNSTTLRTGTTTAQTVVSKKGVAPYNYVIWGNSTSDLGTSGAAYLAKTMYRTSASITSTLCYGCQWDAMCRYIGDSNRKTATGSLMLTGNVSSDVSKNVYDLAGNCLEWTMEAFSTNSRAVRGGCFIQYLGVNNRNPRVTDDSMALAGYGFRCALYIK